MRSPADAAPRARTTAEWALRALALGALALAAWGARPRDEGARTARPVDTGASLAALADSTRDGDTLLLRLADAPGAERRALLAALGASGRRVRWEDAGVPALAASAEPARAPAGGARLDVVAPAGRALALGDAAGTLDSLAEGGAASLALPAAAGALAARVGGTRALAIAPESLAIRRVLVLAAAGWEATFAARALEEAGWLVDADFVVAPGAAVSQGGAPPPDTARHAAVVALDSTAARRSSAIARFVRAGGGLVLAGEAGAHPAFAALRAGRPAARVPGVAGAIAGDQPRRGLAVVPVVVRDGAVVVERRDALVTAAARRVGAGRVVQLGYGDTWRWRMEGDDAAPAAHRAWWSAVVGSVARAPVVARRVAAAGDPAPRAALVAALGAPAPRAATLEPVQRRGRIPDSLLLAVAVGALLAEWGSRRLRGAR